MIFIERRGIHFAGPMSGLLAVFLLCLVGSPSATTAQPVSYRDVVVQQTPIRVLRCPTCENSALILAEQDIIKSKKSGFSDQRIAELEGMLMNNRVRKSGFSDQRLAEMEAMLLNGNKMRRSGFSDQRIAEMEAMLMNSMKRPAQRALTGDQSSHYHLTPPGHYSSQSDHVLTFQPHLKRSGFSDQRMMEMETMVLTQVRHIRNAPSDI